MVAQGAGMGVAMAVVDSGAAKAAAAKVGAPMEVEAKAVE